MTPSHPDRPPLLRCGSCRTRTNCCSSKCALHTYIHIISNVLHTFIPIRTYIHIYIHSKLLIRSDEYLFHTYIHMFILYRHGLYISSKSVHFHMYVCMYCMYVGMYEGVVANGLHSLSVGLHGDQRGRLQVRSSTGRYVCMYVHVCMYCMYVLYM